MNCPSCLKKLLWGGEHSYDDHGLEGDGIVSNSSCANKECKVDVVVVYESMKSWQDELYEKIKDDKNYNTLK
mgnify:FL=1